jgi:hypothetical protein
MARFLLRLDVELAAERVHTCLILSKRCGAPAELDVQTHGRAMGDLLEGIERKKPQRCGQRAVGRTRHPLDVDELGERLERQLSEALAFARQPFLEGRWMRPLSGQTLQEVTSIQHDGPFEGIRRALYYELLEVERIYIDSCRVEDHDVTVSMQAGWVDSGKRSAEGKQGLAKPTARLSLGQVAPKQHNQCIPGVSPGVGHCEIGK